MAKKKSTSCLDRLCNGSKHKKSLEICIWMVWQVRPGSYPSLRAICTNKNRAEQVKKALENERSVVGFCDVFVEKNYTDHTYGQNDNDIATLFIRAQRTKKDGD